MSDSAQAVKLYQQALLREGTQPVGRDALPMASHTATGDNPLCGDAIEMRLQIDGQLITAAGFSGQACAVCLAAASLLCRHLPGSPVPSAIELGNRLTQVLTSGKEQPHDQDSQCPEGFEALLSVLGYPARIDCARLPVEVTRRALLPAIDPSPAK